MTVSQRGTDTSGRPIFASDYMWNWWLGIVDQLGFRPTIVQGAYMSRAGGGASASAGYHDLGGCFDLRTWDLTGGQIDAVVNTLRANGAAAWRRDRQHGGMDPHIHFVLGTDTPLNSGAASQWRDYLDGRDGLASRGRDYERRPSPLVTTPPEDDMARYEDQLNEIEKKVDTLGAALAQLVKAEKKRADNQWRREVAMKKALAEQGIDVDKILDEVTEP